MEVSEENSEEKKSEDHICHICARCYDTRLKLTRHIRYMHNKNGKKPVYKKKEDDEESICYICAKVLETRSSLSRHIKYVHEKVRKFRCEYCGQQCAHPSDYKKHVEAVHQQLRPYACNLCDKSFKTVSNHSRHMEVIHGVPMERKIRGKRALAIAASKPRRIRLGVPRKLRDFDPSKLPANDVPAIETPFVSRPPVPIYRPPYQPEMVLPTDSVQESPEKKESSTTTVIMSQSASVASTMTQPLSTTSPLPPRGTVATVDRTKSLSHSSEMSDHFSNAPSVSESSDIGSVEKVKTSYKLHRKFYEASNTTSTHTPALKLKLLSALSPSLTITTGPRVASNDLVKSELVDRLAIKEATENPSEDNVSDTEDDEDEPCHACGRSAKKFPEKSELQKEVQTLKLQLKKLKKENGALKKENIELQQTYGLLEHFELKVEMPDDNT